MGVKNKKDRLKALKKQELLHTIHCKNCVNGNEKNSPKYCSGCAIYEEFSKLGQVLNLTVREREVG